MSDQKHGVVSMLTTTDRTTLFTDTGNMVVLETTGEYDIIAISAYLTSLLTGTTSIPIDLAEFIKPIVSGLDLGDGIAMVHTIEGKEVQGIFYPATKTEVKVDVAGESVSIPDVENLRSHIDRASEEKSSSVVNFLMRLAPVIKDRQHSGEDLMKFIKESQLPLTDDGRIIAYKKVDKIRDGVYVDCYTKKIVQSIGSRVEMDISMVDPNRNQSCSHGLHVCNLGYLKGFHGDSILICLVDPTHFIAVPHNENTKARVKSYDVIGVIPSTEIKTNNKYLESIISRAVEGKTAEPFQLVTIKPNGQIIYSYMKDNLNVMKTKTKRSQPASGKALEPAEKVGNIVKTVRAIKTAVMPSLAEQARKMYDEAAVAELIAFKKAKKKSWSSLGFTDREVLRILPS